MYLLAAEINWPVIIIVGVVIVALLLFINKRNLKDETDMEETMNQVEEKPSEHDNNDSKT
jgi:uncharacterized membrane protein